MNKILLTKKNIKLIEKVQRRATKLVPSIKSLDYQQRLFELNLSTLEDRRKRGDLIQFYKFYYKFNIIKWHTGYVKSNIFKQDGPPSGLRRNSQYLTRPKTTNCTQRENFFLNRVIPHWNALPSEVVNSRTINQFKSRLDLHLQTNCPSYVAESRRQLDIHYN